MMMWGQGEDDTKGKHDPHTTLLYIYVCVCFIFIHMAHHTHTYIYIYIIFTSTIVFRWQNLNEMQF